MDVADKYRRAQKYSEAVVIYEMLAKQGNSEAEAWLAYFHLMEWGGCENPQLAFYLSQIGTLKRIPFAFNNLGFCYQHARGIGKDLGKAIESYQKGASLGNSYAQHNLGICFKEWNGSQTRFKRSNKIIKTLHQNKKILMLTIVLALVTSLVKV